MDGGTRHATRQSGGETVGVAPRIPAYLVPWLAGALVVTAFMTASVMWGIPWSRDRVAVWIMIALAATCVGTLRTSGRRLFLDWAPPLTLLFAYDLLRGYADGVLNTVHFTPQITADKAMFAGTTPTVLLQDLLYREGELHWWDAAAWAIYMSHFFVGLLVAAIVWRVAHHRFHAYAASFVTLTLAGFVTYAAFPAAPPWMASLEGSCAFPDLGGSCLLEPTTRIIPVVWGSVDVGWASAMFQHGSRYANDVAAVPSLHAAYPMLLLMFFWNTRGWWLRSVLILYTVSMGLTLVYTAEHYAIDILLGWLYAMGSFVIVRGLTRHHTTRHATPEPDRYDAPSAGA